MPTYDFHCKSCDTKFEKFLRISDMEQPVNSPCPECNIDGTIERIVCSPMIVDPFRLNPQKHLGGFNEVLSKIHHNNYKSNLNQKLY